jgi:hypothetical protein
MEDIFSYIMRALWLMRSCEFWDSSNNVIEERYTKSIDKKKKEIAMGAQNG